MNIGKVLEGKQVCICAGSGGVGKTTAAAAIALGLAAEGQRVAVVTIDPAKRLANSLGLVELGNEAKLVEPGRFARQGLEMKGELWAMMLDAKRTWDDLIEHHAPDEKTRDNVLQNRIYQHVSNALAGSQEYMAMEKLYELYKQGRFDMLVLDTPPTRNALDFLDAPERLTNFIEGRSLQFILNQGRFGLKVFGRGTSMLFSLLKRLTGMDLLKDLSEFFASFGDMAEGFRERADAVNKLLRDKRTAFVLVSAPEREPIEEAIFFWERMKQAKLHFGTVVINKVHHDYLKLADSSDSRSLTEIMGQVERGLDSSLNGTEAGAELAAKVLDNFHDYQVLAERDRENIKGLMNRIDERHVIEVPYFDDDIHDIAGLKQINRYLFTGADERQAMMESVEA